MKKRKPLLMGFGERHPVLVVSDAGFGETPVPADALFQPGEAVEFGRTDHDDLSMSSVVLAVVPAGEFPEYAMADQATPKRPRPLTLSVSEPKSETSYVIQFDFRDSPSDDGIRLYTQSTMLEGARLAEAKLRSASAGADMKDDEVGRDG